MGPATDADRNTLSHQNAVYSHRAAQHNIESLVQHEHDTSVCVNTAFVTQNTNILEPEEHTKSHFTYTK